MIIAFVGTGIIGSGLAVNAVMRGNEVRMYYRRNFEKLEKTIKDTLNIFVEAGEATAAQAEDWFNAIKFTMDMEEAVKGADLVQESIAENLDMKKEMYKTIQSICGDSVIIASSTSNMFPSMLSEGALYPEKIICGHPYNPSYILPLIEVCGTNSSQETLDKAFEVYRAMGKEPVLCKKEVSGLIVNSVSWATMAAAKKNVIDGICSVEDMDKAIMFGPGMRMAVTGQILTMSLGIDGGLRGAAAKYGKEPNEEDCILADGVDAMIANRDAEFGNTVEDVKKFRDKALIEMLKIYKKN